MNKWRILIVLSLMVIFVFSAQVVVPQSNLQSEASSPQALMKRRLLDEGGGLPADPFARGERDRPSQPHPNQPAVAADTGGPDAFGYTYDSDIPFDWMDATQGQRTGITGDENYGEIALGFEFPYYEQDWTHANVSTNGFLSFGDGSSGCCGNRPMPLAHYPNNVIAPYWADLEIDPDAGGGIWVLNGGQAPNHFVIVEWHLAKHSYIGGYVTFAVKLMENGDIIMSYADMEGQDGGGIGIEDSTGYVGLEYDIWSMVDSNSTIRFYVPKPKRGALAFPPRQGELASAGMTQTISFSVRNFGRLGDDTLDIDLSSSWPAEIIKPAGEALTDTNGNGLPDTGSLPQGATETLGLLITVPDGAQVGDKNRATVTASSAADANATSTAVMESTIPAAHAQAIIADYDERAVGLNILKPSGQRKAFTTVPYWGGNDPAAAEIAGDGFAYVWTRSTWVANRKLVSKLYLAVTDKFGSLNRNIQTPFDPSGAYAGVEPISAHDRSSALTVAPNGHIGLVWVRFLYNESAGENVNVFFAVFNKNGDRIVGPVNITNFTTWEQWTSPNYKWVGQPQVTATEDGRFILTWDIQQRTSSGNNLQTVYYAAAGNDGSLQRGPTPLTPPGTNIISGRPAVSAAPNNQATIFHTYENCQDSNICNVFLAYSVVDAKNNLSTKYTLLDYPRYYLSIDATLLNDGRTFVAWSNFDHLRYAVLGPQLDVEVTPRSISDPQARFDIFYPSVAPSGNDQAVVTWRDRYNQEITYALFNSSGAVLTQPAIAYQGRSSYPYVNGGNTGSGTTSFSWQPPAGADAAVRFNVSSVATATGQAARIPVTASNLGQSKATGVELNLTLAEDLTYIGDDSGFTPAVDGNKISWTLPDLILMESYDFNVIAEFPDDAVLGDKFTVTASLDIHGKDVDDSNNSATTNVMVASQALLPAVSRP